MAARKKSNTVLYVAIAAVVAYFLIRKKTNTNTGDTTQNTQLPGGRRDEHGNPYAWNDWPTDLNTA